MSETISVVIPAYNSEAFIEKAVQSVLAQELLPEEIIIVDDGSTDKTKEIVRKLVAGQRDKKPRIKYILQANQGPAVARNTGIKNAEGDYIAFLDADDRWLPARLKKQMDVLRERPEAGMVCSGRLRVDEVTGRKTIDCAGSKLSNDSYRDLWTRGNYVVTSTVLARKKCFDAVGGFDEDPRVLGSEDAEMWLRVAEKYPIVYINEPLVEYLVRLGGMNRSNIQRSYESGIFMNHKHEPELRRKYKDAATLLQKKWGRIYANWGMTLLNTGRYEEAREKLTTSLKFRPMSLRTLKFYSLTLISTSLLLSLKRWKRKATV